MWRLLAAALLVSAAGLAGCIGDEDGTTEPIASTEQTPADPAPTDWSTNGTVELGWLAAAGSHVFVGDTIVGVRSHDACPSASFIVPEGATVATIDVEGETVGSGVGTYTVAVDRPGAVTYLAPAAGSGSMEAEGPAPGIWTIEMKPDGATVGQTWTVHVGLEGSSAEPIEEIAFKMDGDCLL